MCITFQCNAFQRQLEEGKYIDNLITDVLTLGSQMDKKTIDPEAILAAVAGQNLM